MTSSELEAQAAEARNNAADRREALDQREDELSGKLDDLEQQIADLQRENKVLAEKLARWNEAETTAVRHLGDCLADLGRAIDACTDSPGNQ